MSVNRSELHDRNIPQAPPDMMRSPINPRYVFVRYETFRPIQGKVQSACDLCALDQMGANCNAHPCNGGAWFIEMDAIKLALGAAI